ncbi:sigma-54-dependent Fis family transcriptional regulator [Undibacterium sp.]|jgi:transcriptional regulator of acetoin/glycerol metabolism|uniref:sigma-54-dependent Fis family transcriptional regulator n=1 Tax=Undibacterium sp. TaxID=1914977 RepID=UPI002B740778|nr:sigma-54-dependent Fis family transcriptional regulator [Undibacterium sp.]HTD03388.1 sigma-54-dependent Fis family transcriptional regulator [Undibacterium sp.]
MRQAIEPGKSSVQATPQAPSKPASIISASTHPDLLQESRQRSAAFGLDAHASPDFSALSHKELSMAIEQSRALHAYALPVMETLYEQICDTHSMVVLTDVKGHILHSFGDNDFLQRAEKVAIRPGVSWAESSKGTNAIGTALAEQAPALIHADDHYMVANHFLTCSAAPIFDHQGNVIGVLDVTGDYRSYHKHTMALVRMSAQMIENQLFSAAFEDAITLHFHSRPEFIGTLMEGIASFTPGGRFLSANRSALFQLGLPLAALQPHTFSSLFGLPVSALFDHYRAAAPQFLSLTLPGGVRVSARAELKLSQSFSSYAPTELSKTASRVPASAMKANPASSLASLKTGDASLAALIDKVSKVLGRDIPILITGETGSGKELLAQAIHHGSPRAPAPFIAVNCASIPETLIESELFGYEDGAFTGARKKGNTGKILQAQGGTLFLDEIGDMPLNMQARLLRVLQERMITPLGSNKSTPVDIAIICATNRNLRELIGKNAFRDDLYYRLNGLVLKLPPLRDRTDIAVIIKKMLRELSSANYTIAPEVMQLFQRHSWPGNLRQLNNLLRTAVIMSDDTHEIRREHLPEDFLEEMGILPTRSAASDAAASPPVLSGKLQELELTAIQQALQQHGGNVSAAARALGVSRNTIYRKAHH